MSFKADFFVITLNSILILNPEQDKWSINPTSHGEVIGAGELSDAVKMGLHYEINSTINGTVLQFKEDLPTRLQFQLWHKPLPPTALYFTTSPEDSMMAQPSKYNEANTIYNRKY